MTIRLRNNILLSGTGVLGSLVLFDLDLLLRRRRRGVSQFLNLLPLFVCGKVGLDGREQLVEGVCDGGFEDLGGQLGVLLLVEGKG